MLTSHAPRPTVVADFESAIEAHTHIGEVMKAVIMGFDPNQSGCQNKDYRVSLQILHDLALKCMDRQASSERWHRRIRNRFKADARKELDELVDYMGYSYEELSKDAAFDGVPPPPRVAKVVPPEAIWVD